jgi:hypothetical protein
MEKEILLWCKENGWTGLYYDKEEDRYYASPPGETNSLPVPVHQKSDEVFRTYWLYKEFTLYGFINYWICFSIRFVFDLNAYGLWISIAAFLILSVVLFLEWRKSVSKDLPTPQLGTFVFGSLVAFALQFLLIPPV